ncbi:carbohydrate-binding module family 18 protein [Xylaria intraflava]|nr:carbohydrate-binding module family 18 protein [Xylaria intraflava]
MAWFHFASLLFTVCSIVAAFDIQEKSNVVVYYSGSGLNQRPLSDYCGDNSIDILILSFVYLFPHQANGYPGIDFGNRCSKDRYAGPGFDTQKDTSKDKLLKCPDLQKDLQICRQAEKTILLSLGGESTDYQLNGEQEGTNLAVQLWGMFGPRDSNWVSQGLPRPFDDGDTEFVVDGFDLDIEHKPDDNFAGYRAFVAKLRELYDSADGTYYLTASPQCVVPDANMGEIIKAGTFDMVLVQFYNTPACSARRWVDANSNYVPGNPFDAAGFTFDDWVKFLANTPSKDARVYIGVPASPAAANKGNEISSAQARSLAAAYYCNTNFGGISIWSATYASSNVEDGKNFFQNAKESLQALAADTRLPCYDPARAQPKQPSRVMVSGAATIHAFPIHGLRLRERVRHHLRLDVP